MRPIDADELIEDLLYDVELDDHVLDSTDIAGLSRVMCQTERGCKQEMIDMLKQAPTIEQPHWIPCSERLPEESGRYIVSVLDGIDRRTTVAPYQPRCKAWTMTGRMAYWKVIAWMPLPEPYEGQK